ncbi:NACHT domain-containing protein [Embleya sp. NPDC059237]|uniref:NACHT domain-containing protein n=1 Tax=Embleya sp. NPDC059237 TaxID=3346784 RepID=UPI0036B5F9DB
MVGTAVSAAWELKQGRVDLVGMLLTSAGLIVAVWSGWPARAALRHQETDTSQMAKRLADQILEAETRERARLLGDATAIDVRFILRPAPAHNATGADPDGQLSRVVDYYRALRPGRLVITGKAGSGKTVLAIELLLALLEVRGPDDPVPVRISLTSWTALSTDPATSAGTGTGDAVRAWIRAHLVDTINLPVTALRALVDGGMILPVLDGLDEMDPTDPPNLASGAPAPQTPRAKRALEELNAYQHGTKRASLILTSRSAIYDALGARARDTARVEIAPLGTARARAFILSRAAHDDPHPWHDVLDALDLNPSGPLARVLSTPWRLTMAVTVHEQRNEHGALLYPPRLLLSPALDTEPALRNHLIHLFLQTTATANPRPPGGPDPHHVHAWLRVLARYLEDNTNNPRTLHGRTLSGTDLVPHELWPLAGDRRVRAAHALLTGAFGTAAIIGLWIPGAGSTPAGRIVATVAFVLMSALGAIHAWWKVWAAPAWFDLEGLRTTKRRRRAALSLVVALALGSLVGLELGFLFGLAAGLAIALLGWLRAAANGSEDNATRLVDPRDLPRANLVVTLVLGLVGGLSLGLICALLSEPGFGLMVGFAYALMVGIAGSRGIVFLMCVRRGPHRLPWRLGRFLNWATEAGLLRVAGTAYQFRHRELQEWLARTPPP